MRRRTVAVLAIASATAFLAAPAAGYWSGPVTVDVSVELGRVAAPDEVVAARGVDGDPHAVSLRWSGSADGPAPQEYLIEVADLDGAAGDASAPWRRADLKVSCPRSECLAVDRNAPDSAAYRVTARAGTRWVSEPSTVSRSWVVRGQAAPPPSESPVPEPPAPSPAPSPTPIETPTAEPPTPGPELATQVSDDPCDETGQVYSFPVPGAARRAETPHLGLWVAGSAEPLVETATPEGWAAVGRATRGQALELPSQAATEVLVLRLCGGKDGAGNADGRSGPVLTVDT